MVRSLKVVCVLACVCLYSVTYAARTDKSSRVTLPIRDSLVQVYGFVVAADSMIAIPGVRIHVKGTGRGTVSNQQGVFSIVAHRGDVLEFAHANFRGQKVKIPHIIGTNLYSMVQVLSYDTVRMPEAIIKPRPLQAEFERDFLAFWDVSSLNAAAMENASPLGIEALYAGIAPADKQASVDLALLSGRVQRYNSGTLTLFNAFDPQAWRNMIKYWKGKRTSK